MATRIDSKGRLVRSQVVHEDAMCATCADDEIMTVRAAYRHHDQTGHTIRVQRIRITEVSKP